MNFCELFSVERISHDSLVFNFLENSLSRKVGQRIIKKPTGFTYWKYCAVSGVVLLLSCCAVFVLVTFRVLYASKISTVNHVIFSF